MEEALRAFLAGDVGVIALIGTRIAWKKRPQAGALPAIVLHKIDKDRDYTMGGRSGLSSSRVQVDCWGASYASAEAVARAVVSALDALPTPSLNAAFVDSEGDDFEVTGTTEFYRTRLDLMVWHRA